MGLSREQWAFIAPFAGFILLLWVGSVVDERFSGHGSVFLESSRYWVFPLQTVLCGALLWWFWPHYEFGRPRRLVFTTAIALLVLAIWVAPQEWLGFAPRTDDGFDPTVFAENQALWWVMLALRFVRLVVVVPLLEEVFWRGFLLRDLIDPRFKQVPIGAFSWFSFGVVTLAFGAAHWPADFVTALFAGALYNLVAYRTKSLTSCVIAHAVTNLGLGIYIMQTRQWGFW